MLSLLFSLLIALIVVSIVWYVLTLILSTLPLPAPGKQIAAAIAGLILLAWVLGILGVWGPPWRIIP